MLYLLDANVLIEANRQYYPLPRVPEFWEWLVHVGEQAQVKVPLEFYEEVIVGTDALASWLKNHKRQMLLNEEVRVELVARVTAQGYASDLNDEEIEKIGRDPFLIAYGLADINRRCVVTTEHSKPSQSRANRKLPDVCDDFNVRCCDTFKFLRELDFKTHWNA